MLVPASMVGWPPTRFRLSIREIWRSRSWYWTPADVVARYDAAIKKVIAQPEVRKQLENVAVVPSVMDTPDAFKKFFATEFERWGNVIKQAGLQM